MYMNMIQGTAMALFRQYAAEAADTACQATMTGAADAAAAKLVRDAGWEPHLTPANVSQAKRLTLTALIPNKIVAMVKRYLHRECCKPVDMKVRTYYQHLLVQVNQNKLPALPPFGQNQHLLDDEIINILCYRTPKSWSREMDHQKFNPLTSTPTQVVDFLERNKQSEDFDGQRIDHSQKSSSNGKKDSFKKKSGNNKSGGKYCMLHSNCSHSTEECNTLKEQAKKLKTGSSGSDKKFSNKIWTCKASNSTSSNKKELAAFINKSVTAGVCKELNSVDKKRKANDKDSSVDLHTFDSKPKAKPVQKRQVSFTDILDGDLKDFNYTNIVDLTIDDGEVLEEVEC
jgi:hypothetical protein